MRRIAALAVPALVTLVVLGGCRAPSGSPVELPDGSAARRWGNGPYGLVLVHDQGLDAASWGTPAAAFADKGMTVVAVEPATPGAVVSALRSLLEDDGLDRVALLGAGEGGGTAMQAALAEPDLVDQLVVISASGDAAALDVFPKLFVASQGEPAAGDAERMADESRGDWNALFLAPGQASGQALLSDETGGEPAMEAIVARLEERR
jgi:pimeloyl-ACP methyl ester carboxylesterase